MQEDISGGGYNLLTSLLCAPLVSSAHHIWGVRITVMYLPTNMLKLKFNNNSLHVRKANLREEGL